MDNRIETTIKNLENNNMQVFYAENRKEVCDIVRNTLEKDCTIASGGSVSVKESGVWDIINSGDYNFFDRTKAGITQEEKLQAFKATVGCDYYFCSANAVTENGELVNVDGLCNRIASISFGPKNVVMIVGINKIVGNVSEGLLRVKKIAAPLNSVRLNLNTPCRKLGHCVSLENNESPAMTDGCQTDCRICCNYLISSHQREKNRIKIILCGEKLGY